MNFHTSTIDYGQVEPSHNQLDLDLPSDPLTDLNRHKRFTSEQVAKAFLNTAEFSNEARMALDLLDCSNAITVTDKGVESHRRCRKRVCATCSAIKAKDWSHRLDRALKLLPNIMLDEYIPAGERDADDHTIGIKLTLNAGESCPIDDLKTTTKILLSRWPLLLRSVARKCELLGSFRSTEVTINYAHATGTATHSEVVANPHIHGVLLLSPPAGVDLSEWTEDLKMRILKFWKRSILGQLTKAGIRDRSISSSGQEIKALNKHTPDDLISWLKYCSKGLMHSLESQLSTESFDTSYEQVVKVWTNISDAFKGKKLISSSGSIKDALEHVEEIDAIAKKISKVEDQRDGDRVAGRPKITHKWSTPQRRYIPAEQWNPDIDRPLGWQNTALRLRISDQPKQLFNALKRGRDKDTLSDKQRILHHSKFGELLPQNINHV